MSLKTKTIISAAILLILVLVLIFTTVPKTQNNRLQAGFTAEFMQRPDGYKGLTNAYNFEFADQPKQMDPGLMYKALADGAVDVICAFATDGRIEAYNLYTLRDDKNFFPPYHAAPMIRAQTLEKHPELKNVLNKLAGKIDDKTMRQLNYKVDRDKNPLKASTVAQQFLTNQKLIDPNTPSNPNSESDTIVIGGKDFTEQNILGEIMAVLIKRTTDLNVEKKLYLGGTMVCFNALKSGDLDLYAEYTGTGLVSILKLRPDQVKDINETVNQQFRKKWNLVWLEPFGFNNTYTLAMRKQTAEKLSIKTISDLANYINSKNKSKRDN